MFLCAVLNGPISIQKVVVNKMKHVAIGDLLDKHPSEDVFVDFKFDLTDARVHSDKPTMVARFCGWDEVDSHWPGLGFSIYGPALEP